MNNIYDVYPTKGITDGGLLGYVKRSFGNYGEKLKPEQRQALYIELMQAKGALEDFFLYLIEQIDYLEQKKVQLLTQSRETDYLISSIDQDIISRLERLDIETANYFKDEFLKSPLWKTLKKNLRVLVDFKNHIKAIDIAKQTLTIVGQFVEVNEFQPLEKAVEYLVSFGRGKKSLGVLSLGDSGVEEIIGGMVVDYRDARSAGDMVGARYLLDEMLDDLNSNGISFDESTLLKYINSML